MKYGKGKLLKNKQVERAAAASFIRNVRNSARRELIEYTKGEYPGNYFPEQRLRQAFINGVLILFDKQYFFPRWMTDRDFWDKRKEAKAHAQPLADAVV